MLANNDWEIIHTTYDNGNDWKRADVIVVATLKISTDANLFTMFNRFYFLKSKYVSAFQ